MFPLPIKLFKFFTLEEYNNDIINFHNNISNHYKNQNEENFGTNMEILINFLNKENIVIHFDNTEQEFNKDEFLSQLMEMRKKDAISIELLDNINNLIYTENKQIQERLSYFRAALLMKLNLYPILDENNCTFECVEFMNVVDLKRLKHSINQIIFIKNFFKVDKKYDTFFRSIFGKIDSFKCTVLTLFDFQYKVKVIIKYNYRENNIPNYFKNLEEYIFPPFSFFKLMNAEIKASNNSGIIILNNVNRKEILECDANLKNGLIYNTSENIMEIKKICKKYIF